MDVDTVFADPIHGEFTLPELVLGQSRTHPVQRLKRLKQLGLTCLVPRYSYATHTRWQHSLGVAHLAGLVGSSLAAAQPELDLRAEDIIDLQLAGLNHDTGHGPFCHTFEQKILPALGVTDWEHEAMSLQLLEVSLQEAGLDLSSSRVARIQDIISGCPRPGGDAWPVSKKWMCQVVAADGVDVDRGDYLPRDAHLTGRPLSHPNYLDLLTSCRVMELPMGPPVLSYAASQAPLIQGFLEGRYRLFQQVYTCAAAQAIEAMVVDALVAADSTLNLRESIRSVEGFLTLDDSLLDCIAHLGRQAEAASTPDLRKAAHIVKRLHAADLYPCLAEVQLPAELDASLVTAENIATHICGSSTSQPDQLVVSQSTVAMSRQGIDPFQDIPLYEQQSPVAKGTRSRSSGYRPVDSKQNWTILPAQRVVRVYWRGQSSSSASPSHTDLHKAVKDAVGRLLRERAGYTPPDDVHPSIGQLAVQPSTPQPKGGHADGSSHATLRSNSRNSSKRTRT